MYIFALVEFQEKFIWRKKTPPFLTNEEAIRMRIVNTIIGPMILF